METRAGLDSRRHTFVERFEIRVFFRRSASFVDKTFITVVNDLSIRFSEKEVPTLVAPKDKKRIANFKNRIVAVIF